MSDQQPRLTLPKPNKKCYCRSGKKYKTCHGRSDRANGVTKRSWTAWSRARVRGAGLVVRVEGATDMYAGSVNGWYDPQPPRVAGQAGVATDYRQRADPDMWLFNNTVDGKWIVGPTEAKDARKNIGFACTVFPVAAGTLPH